MKTKKKDEIIDEVAKVSMQLHEAEDPERKLCTENGKVFAHQMQTSTSENHSKSADVLFQRQNEEDANVKPSRPPKWIERCKRWLVTYPIIIMILFCSIHMLSSTNAKLSNVDENKRYSDADIDIITELTTDQLTTKLESHGLEYVSDFYVDCKFSRNYLYSENGKEYAVDFKFKPQNANYIFSIVVVFNTEFNYKRSYDYTSSSAKHTIGDNFESYEKKVANRRNSETYLYIKTEKIKFYIDFIDNQKTNTKIYRTLSDTIICNIK